MGRTHSGLEEYRRKRNFSATPEPSGDTATISASRDQPAFVIQKHAARRLHYDFRLEIDGVLKSWAVPKGPSTEVGEKRLAVETEDHPLDYGNFEGIIPAGHYGAGKVLIWDTGTWATESPAQSQYEAGKITFELKGKRLRGRWNLVRTRGRDARNWLLIKGHDEREMKLTAPQPEQEEHSIISGKTFEQLAGDAAPAVDWSVAVPRNAKRRSLERLEPQIPRLVSKVPDGEQWLHELKLDGYRLLAEKDRQRITLYTRNGNDWTAKFSELAERLASLVCSSCVVDGEVVVYNADGTTDFQSLQNSIKGEYSGTRHFVAFDLLYLEGHDLKPLPTHDRKRLLAELLANSQTSDTDTGSESILSSEGIVGNGPAVFEKACDMGLEGIVSKRLDASYRAGKNPTWVKTKCINTDEFVIGGYTEPQGERSHFGALLLGYYQDGQLIYCGKVGTGYTHATLKTVGAQLEGLSRKTSPFATRPPNEGQIIHWVKPELVAQIRYSAWTRDGRLRHPVFEGLREDKPAGQVGREQPADTVDIRTDTDTEAMMAQVRLTSPDKILFSEQRLTKRDLARYYIDIADWILPYIIQRPLSLLRCPSGARKTCFFQRHPQSTFRDPVHTLQIDGRTYVYIEDLTGLLSLVQYGVLEIHPWGARIDDLEHPDTLTFDLDPGPGISWSAITAAGRLIHNRLLAMGLQSFAKLSGGKGLHVVVPLTPSIDWKQLKSFARNFSFMLEREYPDDFVATATKSKRHERIFIDYLRNSKGATSVACYSTRARTNAPVSTPIRWNELSPRISPNRYTVNNLRARLRALQKDPWQDYFTVDQSITDRHLDQVKI